MRVTNEDLRAFCFSENFSLILSLPRTPSVASLSLSGIISDDETKSECDENRDVGISTALYYNMLRNLQLLCQVTNVRVARERESRSGKIKQRWAIDPQNGQKMRLVAGCVPILNDSRIILISSNSGNGWLVPKGGWEDDEELEEGAIRECFEEAGVLGILGPKLETFRVETRKARQRRLESTEPELPVDEVCNQLERKAESFCDPCFTSACELSSLIPTTHVIKPDEEDDPAENKRSKLTHTHVCMTFFPLYVQSIHDSWPEESRARQAFAIDGTFPFELFVNREKLE